MLQERALEGSAAEVPVCGLRRDLCPVARECLLVGIRHVAEQLVNLFDEVRLVQTNDDGLWRKVAEDGCVNGRLAAEPFEIRDESCRRQPAHGTLGAGI